MIDLLSGTRCKVCGMALENSNYLKDERGNGLYWANPKISKFTDVRVDFCSAAHSTQWHLEQVEARKDVTPDTDQTAG